MDILKEIPDNKKNQDNSDNERRALSIQADFNILREQLGEKYKYKSVMNAIAEFSKKIKERFGDSRQNFRLYHVLIGSTINPNRVDEIAEFDFPKDSGLSVEDFIKNGFEQSVKEEFKKSK